MVMHVVLQTMTIINGRSLWIRSGVWHEDQHHADMATCGIANQGNYIAHSLKSKSEDDDVSNCRRKQPLSKSVASKMDSHSLLLVHAGDDEAEAGDADESGETHVTSCVVLSF
jgi:hypothetical protein